MNLLSWAIKWQIPLAAVNDLKMQMGLDGTPEVADGRQVESETGVARLVRLEAARSGVYLWRNNVGAFYDDDNRFIRYGLANDSAAMNKRIKSHDLIGLRPGGQFISRETKAPDWRYTGTAREKGQLKFLELVLALGGDAAFATGEGTI